MINDCEQDEFTLEWSEPFLTQDLGAVLYEIGGSADKNMRFSMTNTKPYCTPNYSVYKEAADGDFDLYSDTYVSVNANTPEVEL